MGIEIRHYFLDIEYCEESVKDIIFTNFLYYTLFFEIDTMNFVKSICKRLLYERICYDLSDDIWEYIWDRVIRTIDLNDDNFLFL